MKLIFQPSITQCILNYFKNLDIDPPKIKKDFKKVPIGIKVRIGNLSRVTRTY